MTSAPRFPAAIFASLSALSLVTQTEALGSSSKKVLLKNVRSLTLRKDKLTTHRRVSAVPQLKCIGGAGCRHHQVDVMRCENVGADYDENSIQWTCQANVPEDFKLGSTEVRCEGYSSPQDPHILKGSCGVEYRLLLTDRGEDRYGKAQAQVNFDFGGGEGGSSSLFSIVFWLVFFGVIFMVARSAWNNIRNAGNRPAGGNRPPRPPPGGGGGGGGWFGGDDNDEPPPPYSANPPPRKTQSRAPRQAQARQQQEGWFRPGVLGGMMGGAAAGYYAGQRRRQGEDFAGYDRSGGRNQGFSGGGGQQHRRDDPGEGSSSSTTFHSTTGFGGTSNR